MSEKLGINSLKVILTWYRFAKENARYILGAFSFKIKMKSEEYDAPRV